MYRGIELVYPCKGCREPIHFNGPIRRYRCPACKHVGEITTSFWTEAFAWCAGSNPPPPGEPRSIEFLVSGHPISLTFVAEPPSCYACRAELGADRVATGSSGVVPCPSCGAENTTFPPDRFLRQAVPRLAQLFNADFEMPKVEERGTDRARTAACPECSAVLEPSRARGALVVCDYCGAEVQLPAELVESMRSRTAPRRWYARFER